MIRKKSLPLPIKKNLFWQEAGIARHDVGGRHVGIARHEYHRQFQMDPCGRPLTIMIYFHSNYKNGNSLPLPFVVLFWALGIVLAAIPDPPRRPGIAPPLYTVYSKEY